ncbi:MAG: S41 family peptidase [Gammaproteobacteria bacterium]|nr:S41 family peptidase [Gammaproteobacteria bacterium]
MNPRTLTVLSIGFILGLSVSSWQPVSAEREPPANDVQVYQDGARLIAEVMDKIKSEYVEIVPDQQLFEAAVSGMVAGLDPHSVFLSAERFRDVKISTTGNYAGIGVELNTENRAIVVVAPIDGGPAARAGMLAGDTIIMVDGVPVNPDSIDEALTHMRGEIGSSVALSVMRKNVAEVLSFDLIREQINLSSVSGRMLEEGLAYVRISQFSETTHQDLHVFLSELARLHGKLQGLVIDLRNNPGGVLDAAVRVSDIFLDDGVIVTADGRTDSSDFEFSAHPGDAINGAGLVVLVNSGSASAAEIVAGALQDHARSTVIGEKTFGKGSVQTVLPLADGQALKLTTSYYFTPSGASIHGQGIEPDIVVEQHGESDLPLQSAVDHLKSARLQSRNH